MSQTEVLEFLQKNKGKWYTAREITNEIKTSSFGSITSNLKCLRKSGLTNYRTTIRQGHEMTEYTHKEQ